MPKQSNGTPGKKPLAPSVSRSVLVAANVDPSEFIRQHVTVVIVPIVGVPNSRDEAMEMPPMNAAVTDKGETAIAADAVCHKGGGARDTAAHQRIAGNATAHKGLADNATAHKWIATNATVHKRVAAEHSAPGKARTTSADATSAARGAASDMPTASAAMTAAASAAMCSHRADRNCRHTKRNRRDHRNSELM
jgi:hypothetical protein